MLLNILILIFILIVAEIGLSIFKFSLKSIGRILLIILAVIGGFLFIGAVFAGFLAFIGWLMLLIIKVTFVIAGLSLIIAILNLVWKVIKRAIK